MARVAGRLSTRIPAGALPTIIELASVARDVPLVGLPAFLSLPDGGVSGHVDRLAAELATAVERHRPDVVFAPWVGDRHPDHRAVTRALACLDLKGTEVWGYEVHDPTVPNRAVDISAVVTRKRAALAAHVTAGLALNLEATLALNRWRSLGVRGGNGWAECFHAVGGDELRALVERTAQPTAESR